MSTKSSPFPSSQIVKIMQTACLKMHWNLSDVSAAANSFLFNFVEKKQHMKDHSVVQMRYCERPIHFCNVFSFLITRNGPWWQIVGAATFESQQNGFYCHKQILFGSPVWMTLCYDVPTLEIHLVIHLEKTSSLKPPYIQSTQWNTHYWALLGEFWIILMPL